MDPFTWAYGCPIARPKVLRKLAIQTPSAELVDAYLTEIAKAYGIGWTSPDVDTVKVCLWALPSIVSHKPCY